MRRYGLSVCLELALLLRHPIVALALHLGLLRQGLLFQSNTLCFQLEALFMVARQTTMFHPNARMIHPRRLG